MSVQFLYKECNLTLISPVEFILISALWSLYTNALHKRTTSLCYHFKVTHTGRQTDKQTCKHTTPKQTNKQTTDAKDMLPGEVTTS